MVELGSSKKVSPGRRADIPFPAVVGQDRLKEALLAVAANADLDGLLVRGEKGTAKSTTARALVELLPDQRVVSDCPYGCPPEDSDRQCADCREREDPPVETRPVPFVTLPLGASRERVVGSLSVADALDGEAEFNPGLLAQANRGVLYVDEVNLLDDHLVDVLLDAAAAGVNHVERDGVSVTHPAEFTIIGTMNPEEGTLRPQFRDRFALQVEVEGADEIEDRVEILDRALDGFGGDYEQDTAAVRDRLLTARDLLADVELSEDFAASVAELCRDAGVEGHRADIATARAARTLAALDGRPTVIESDVRQAAALALPHRLQSRPFEDAPDPEDVVDDHFEDEGEGGDESNEAGADDEEREEAGDVDESDATGDESGTGDGAANGSEGVDQAGPGEDNAEESRDAEADGDEDGSEDNPRPNRGPAPEPCADGEEATGDADHESETDSGDGDGADEATPLVPGQPRSEAVEPVAGAAPDVSVPDAEHASDGGRARASPSTAGRGPRVRTERADASGTVDAAASVRAAAARGGQHVESRDLRQSVRAGSESALVVFAVDASASMRGPMRATKGVALDVLRDAYERRDEVAVVTFAGENADVVLPPTDSVDLAARHLKSLPTGDRTPLPAGLQAADEVLARADPETAVVILVTDGRATAGTDRPTRDTREAAKALEQRGAHVLVVDAGDGGRTSLVEDVVEAADGETVPLDALTPDRVDSAVQRATRGDRL